MALSKQRIKWSLPYVERESPPLFNNRMDYSLNSPEDIRNAHSRLKVRCKICVYTWETSTYSHIVSRKKALENGSKSTGCDRCDGKDPWDIESITNVSIINNLGILKFDYSSNKSGNIKLLDPLNVKCLACSYAWETTIQSHIKSNTKCGRCEGYEHWTYERVMREQKPHIDYSEVKPEHVKNYHSEIPVSCRICDFKWTPKVGYLHESIIGCLDCSGELPWSYEKINRKSEQYGLVKHFDYSLNTLEQIYGLYMLIKILCRTCGYVTERTIIDHFHGGSGCKRCKQSIGEYRCMEYLEGHNIQHIKEYKPKDYNRFYDFLFEYNGVKCLIEYDGQRHFNYNKHFHRKGEEEYRRRQLADIHKTRYAIENGYYLIRIDFRYLKSIHEQLDKALGNPKEGSVHYSDIAMYKYIIEGLEDNLDNEIDETGRFIYDSTNNSKESSSSEKVDQPIIKND